MGNHLAAIGFPAETYEEFEDLAMRALDRGGRFGAGHLPAGRGDHRAPKSLAIFGGRVFECAMRANPATGARFSWVSGRLGEKEGSR